MKMKFKPGDRVYFVSGYIPFFINDTSEVNFNTEKNINSLYGQYFIVSKVKYDQTTNIPIMFFENYTMPFYQSAFVLCDEDKTLKNCTKKFDESLIFDYGHKVVSDPNEAMISRDNVRDVIKNNVQNIKFEYIDDKIDSKTESESKHILNAINATEIAARFGGWNYADPDNCVSLMKAIIYKKGF